MTSLPSVRGVPKEALDHSRRPSNVVKIARLMREMYRYLDILVF
jgi:hypothetical protein